LINLQIVPWRQIGQLIALIQPFAPYCVPRVPNSSKQKTPAKVAISEYVDVAKAFFPEGREPKFVNAVLDHMAREVHPDQFK
jgi:hypothetical protein